MQKSLATAIEAKQERSALVLLATNYIASADFVGSADANPLNGKLAALRTQLDALERAATVTHADIVNTVRTSFGSTPAELMGKQDVPTAMRRLRDSMVAIKLVQKEHGRPIEALANQLRDLEIIAKTAADSAFPSSPGELRRYRRRSLQQPLSLGLKSVLSTAYLQEKAREAAAAAEAERQQRAQSAFDKYQRLNLAIAELTSLETHHLISSPQAEAPGFIPPEEVTPSRVVSNKAAYVQQLSALNLQQLEAAIAKEATTDPLLVQEIAGAGSATLLAHELLANTPRLLPGKPAFKPLGPADTGFRLKATATQAISAQTQAVLAERKVVVTEKPLDHIVESLQSELAATSLELEELYGQPVQHSIKRIGDTLVSIATPLPSSWATISIGAGPRPQPPPAPPVESIPHTTGQVAPAGVADLILVKQQLIGYEAADIAHIENVLKGELKSREHTRTQTKETLSFTETEVEISEERELESTDRFEMTRETNVTIKEEASLKAGLTVTGSYGPSVDFSASAEGAASRSKEEATRTASAFSQEVTQKSASKITERVLERTSLKITSEIIEKNVHQLNNVGGAGHICGVYQWVNKIYQAQMFNYGLRTMFDFMVPEPAAFLMEALKSAHASIVEIQKPLAFPLKPSEVTESNYGFWVRAYGATDVTPPPEQYKTKSLDFKAGGGDDSDTDYNHSAQVTIDEGYKAVQGSVVALWNIWQPNYSVDLALGRRTHRIEHESTSVPSWVWITPLDSERDSVPFALDTFKVSQVAVAVEVKCQRTARALDKWRFETHAKLTTAYQARLAEYEEKLAALEVQAGVPIQGRNPAMNLEVMKDELKKHCISILTDQHYDLFDAIDIAASNALPQIDVTEAQAEGAYVRFFEQAFEWENITWLTYPYFWGRKSKWGERIAFADPDPLFNQFLKAGYCRVSVPARPGFEGAIDHFMNYGELWNGGPLPPISSPLYLPIADELAERLHQPGDEVPQGDPWTVRIPTTLVRLRPDDSLPRWTQDENGAWIET